MCLEGLWIRTKLGNEGLVTACTRKVTNYSYYDSMILSSLGLAPKRFHRLPATLTPPPSGQHIQHAHRTNENTEPSTWDHPAGMKQLVQTFKSISV